MFNWAIYEFELHTRKVLTASEIFMYRWWWFGDDAEGRVVDGGRGGEGEKGKGSWGICISMENEGIYADLNPLKFFLTKFATNIVSLTNDAQRLFIRERFGDKYGNINRNYKHNSFEGAILKRPVEMGSPSKNSRICSPRGSSRPIHYSESQFSLYTIRYT